jgi:hypothetical protein
LSLLESTNSINDAASSLASNPDDFLSIAEIRDIGSATYEGPFVLANTRENSEEGFFGEGRLTVRLAPDVSYRFDVTGLVHSDTGFSDIDNIAVPDTAVLTPSDNNLIDLDSAYFTDADDETEVPGAVLGGSLFLPASSAEGRDVGFDTVISGTATAQFTDSHALMTSSITADDYAGSNADTEFEGLSVGEVQ